MFINLAEVSLSIRQSTRFRHAISNGNVVFEKSVPHIFKYSTYGVYLFC